MNRQDISTLSHRLDKITAQILAQIHRISVEEDVSVDLIEFLDWIDLFFEDYKVMSFLSPERQEEKLDEFQIRAYRIADEFLRHYGIRRELKIPDTKYLSLYVWNRRYRYFFRNFSHFIEDIRKLSGDEDMVSFLASPLIYYMIYELKRKGLSGNERSKLRMELNVRYKQSVVRMLNRVTGARHYLNCDRLYVKGD